MEVSMRGLSLLVFLTLFPSCKHANTSSKKNLPASPIASAEPQADWTFKIDPTATHMSRPRLSTKPQAAPTGTQLTTPQISALNLPATFDWRNYGLSPVRDQGYVCGSCWTFAAASMTQDIISLFRHPIGPISAQYAMSCNTGGASCVNGGSAYDALNLYRDQGIVLESDYPYAEADLTCNTSVPHGEPIKSWGWADPVAAGQNFAQDDVEAVKRAVFQYGPVATSIKITTPFAYYQSGVFNACDALAPGDTDHIVNIVGWDNAGQYWIIRNSWSDTWGEKGYMRIKWNCLNVGSATTFAVVDKLQTPKPLPPPDVTPPTCRIIVPASNHIVPRGLLSINVKIDARDNIGVISSKVLINGIDVGPATGGIYKIKLAGLKAGTYRVSCVATDKAGNTGKSLDTTIKIVRPI